MQSIDRERKDKKKTEGVFMWDGGCVEKGLVSLLLADKEGV